MKTLSYVTAIGLALFIASATPAQSQEEYSFFANAWGPQVCLGNWTPPSDSNPFGVCEGQIMGIPQLTAISSKQTVERLDQLLAVSVDKDRMARFTTQGIHKDDLELLISGYPLKKFGSQGQQKSFVVAIKLAQFDYTRNIKGFKPVLLFDDIFDKLDEKRVHQIIRLVSENSFGQVFISDTQRSRIERLFEEVDIDHRIFMITAGKIEIL